MAIAFLRLNSLIHLSPVYTNGNAVKNLELLANTTILLLSVHGWWYVCLYVAAG